MRTEASGGLFAVEEASENKEARNIFVLDEEVTPVEKKKIGHVRENGN